MLLTKIDFFRKFLMQIENFFARRVDSLKDLLKTVVKMRRCHLKKPLMTP
jgi:hypothetical protein